MDVTGFHEGRDVGFVRVRGEWVAQENDCRDLFGDDESADLEVAAEGTGEHLANGESNLGFQQSAGCASGYNGVMREEFAVGACPVEHRGFFAVVGDKCQSFHCGFSISISKPLSASAS